MGYTHYWKSSAPFADSAWKSFVTAAKKLFALKKDILANGFGEEGTSPEIGEDFVSFNGIGDAAHETCHITKNAVNFEFCKTARKEYDAVVVEILLLARLYNPTLVLTSDGGANVFKIS